VRSIYGNTTTITRVILLCRISSHPQQQWNPAHISFTIFPDPSIPGENIASSESSKHKQNKSLTPDGIVKERVEVEATLPLSAPPSTTEARVCRKWTEHRPPEEMANETGIQESRLHTAYTLLFHRRPISQKRELICIELPPIGPAKSEEIRWGWPDLWERYRVRMGCIFSFSFIVCQTLPEVGKLETAAKLHCIWLAIRPH